MLWFLMTSWTETKKFHFTWCHRTRKSCMLSFWPFSSSTFHFLWTMCIHSAYFTSIYTFFHWQKVQIILKSETYFQLFKVFTDGIMFDASQNISHQLRKNLKTQSSLSLFIFTLEIIWKPGLLLCSVIPSPISYCATLSALKGCMRQDTN